jgi:hypothetical protein
MVDPTGIKALQADLKTIARYIGSIREGSCAATTIDEWRACLQPLTVGHAARAAVIRQGTDLWRGRRSSRPQFLRDVGPPPHSVVGLGRANRAGRAVFYAGSTREIPFFELSPQPGEFLVLGRWRTTDRLITNSVGYTTEIFDTLGSNRRPDVPWAPSHDTDDPRDVLISSFFGEVFTERATDAPESQAYLVSNAIAEELLKGDAFDGLTYPAVDMFANGENVALGTRSFEDKLEPVSVEYCHILEVGPESFEIDVIDFANEFSPNGEILWKGRGPQWAMPDGATWTARSESGRWVVRDEVGEVVDPD